MNPATGTTLNDLYLFLDTAYTKSGMAPRTIDNHRAVVRRFQRQLDLPLTVDLRGIDLDDAIAQFHTGTEGRYTATSRTTYADTFKRAITNFLSWIDNDANWDSVTARRYTFRAARAATATHETHRFPLRPNENVLLRLPRDITKAEAHRLATFITALAMATEPAG